MLFTVAALLAVLWWASRQGRAHALPTLWHRLAYAVAVGLVSALVLLVLTLVFAVRVSASGVEVEITSAGVRLVLFGTLLIAAAAYAGQEIGRHAQPGLNWLGAGRTAFARLPRFLREFAAYAAFGALVFGVLGAIFVAVQLSQSIGVGAIAVAIIGFLNIAVFAAVLGHLGGLTVGGGLGGYASSQTGTLFGLGEPLLWLIFLAALVLTAFVALWIGTRRVRTATIDWTRAWLLPVTVLVAWFLFDLLFFGIGVGGAGSAGILGGSVAASIGVAPWSPFVLFLWAVLVELGAQFLPRIVYGVSPRLHGFLAGRAHVAAWVAGSAVAIPGAVSAAVLPEAGGQSATPAAGVLPATDGNPANAAAPLAAPAPLSPAAKRGLIIGGSVLGGVVVLGVGATIAIGVLNSSRSPEAAALSYVQSIENGNAEAANAAVDPNVPNADRAFLTNDVLGAASERISDVSVERVDAGGGDTAYVEVSYKLDGVTQTAQLSVQKGAPEWLVLDTWEVQDSLAQTAYISVSGTGSASIGGVEIPIDEESGYGSAEIVLYPGVYEVTGDDSPYFALEESSVSVGGSPEASLSLTFAPTSALTEEVQKQVDALVDSCVQQTSDAPDGCPFSVYTYDDAPVTWTLTESPVVEIDDDGLGFWASDGLVTATYTETFFGESEQSESEDSFDVSGDLTIDGDTVTVDFDDDWW